MEKKKELINFGFANGWRGNPPELVDECDDAKHSLTYTQLRGFTREVKCITCGYKYTIDSSG